MMNLVITVCEKFITIISLIPELLSSYTMFKSTVELILITAKEQMVELKGITIAKNELKKALSTSASIVAAAIRVYAHKNKIYNLEKEMSYSEYALLRLSDLNIQKVAAHIFDQAKLYATDIVSYGIKTDDITTLSTDINAYSIRYNEPIMAIEMRKFHTKN